MVDILLLVAIIVNVVIVAINEYKRLNDKKELLCKIEQCEKDVQAIADALNIYSESIKGTVTEQVKGNIDLFSEWLTGEED